MEDEVAALFSKHSIPELRLKNTEISNNVDLKKLELRLMVGERYRDLIDAADSISKMNESTGKLRSLFQSINENCNVHILKEKVDLQLKNSKVDAVEEKKKLLYPVAAQLKVLVDTPEQIWHALENHQYLRACRLYLIAKLIYKNLQSSPEAASLKLPVSFPVVQRQWDAVSHFRSQIIQKAQQYLKKITVSDQDLTESLCAIMLLDSATQRQVFLKFTEMRKQAINESLTTTASVSNFHNVIKCVDATLRSINAIFKPTDSDPNISLLDAYITSLQRKSSHETKRRFSFDFQNPSSGTSSILTGLFSEKANMHIILRYLPTSIQNYTPVFNFGSPSVAGVTMEDLIKQTVPEFVQSVLKDVSKRLDAGLESVNSGVELARMRSEVMKFVAVRENKVAEDVWVAVPNFGGSIVGYKHSIPSISWVKLCDRLNCNSFSLWGDLFRELFQTHSKSLINKLLNPISEYLRTHLMSQIDSFQSFPIGVSSWINPLSNFLNFSKSLVPDIFGEIVEGFAKFMFDIVEDVSPLLDFEENFGLDTGKDDGELVETYVDGWRHCVNLLSVTLNGMMETYFIDGSIDKALLIGHVSGRFSSRIRESKLVFPKHGEENVTADIYSKISLEVEALLFEVYFNTFSKWSEVSSRNLFEKFQLEIDIYRKDSEFGIWEDVTPESNNSKVRIPVQILPLLSSLLAQLCDNINNAAGYQLKTNVLKAVLVTFSTKILKVYETWLLEHVATLSGLGAVQMLFDVKFVIKVFQSLLDENSNIAILEMITKMVDRSDFVALGRVIDEKVDLHFRKTCVLYGLLLLSPPEPDMKGIKVEEIPGVMATVSQPPRFILLPIASKSHVKSPQSTSPFSSSTQINTSEMILTTNTSNAESSNAAMKTNNTRQKPPLKVRVYRTGTTPANDVLAGKQVPQLVAPSISSQVGGVALSERSQSGWNLGQAGKATEKATEMLFNAGSFFQGLGGVWAAGSNAAGSQSPALSRGTLKKV